MCLWKCILCLSKVLFLCVYVFWLALTCRCFTNAWNLVIVRILSSCQATAGCKSNHNQLRNHLYLPAVKRLSITLFDMQNRIQSQTFAVIISCLYIYIFFLSSIFFLLNLKTFRSITAGIHGITGVRITGISRGWLRVSQKRAAERGGFPKPHLGHK